MITNAMGAPHERTCGLHSTIEEERAMSRGAGQIGIGARVVVTFLAAAIVGTAIAAVSLVLADSPEAEAPQEDLPASPVVDVKRKPDRDLPGPAFSQEPLPEGRLLRWEDGVVQHGPFLIFPGGRVPKEPEADDNWLRKGTFSNYSFKSAEEIPEGVFEVAGELPNGYVPLAGGVSYWTSPEGERVPLFATVRLENGRNAPIDVQYGLVPNFLQGEPTYEGIPEPGDVIALTIGEVAGHPALFYHRRPGVKTAENQRIHVAVGSYYILIEGYVDSFERLRAVAEQFVRGMEPLFAQYETELARWR